ncbi:MAG TPA: T9SS type A sorting domain-containing protein [Chitinophagaceae bacterium]
MFRKSTLSFILTVFAFAVGKFSFATTYVYDGITPLPNPLALNSGDSLFVATGTYSGNISSFVAGAKITVSDMAIFQPATFPNTNGNSARGTMWVYGTFTFNTTFVSNTLFTLHNYGVVTLGSTTMRGNNQTWTNYYGATINFTSNVVMNGDFGNNNVLNNYGTVNASTNFQMNNGSAFNNYKNFMVAGDFLANGGVLTNEGKLEVVGKIDLNNGVSTITNYCRMIASGGIDISNGNMINYSYLWARNDLGLGTIRVSSGSLTNRSVWGSTPMIHGRDLIHTGGIITGSGYLYFYGTTSKSSNAGNGYTGSPGITTDTLKMNDITRGSTTQFYDNQTGTVYPNAIYNVWGVPDSTRVYNVACSIEIILEVPLAINWNSFTVNLSDNIPVLNWSAEFSSGAVFGIQRSYDGRNFSTIKDMDYIQGQSEYEYKDRMVNIQAPVVYYRIKATEISGIEKYTQIRTVKFSSKPGGIYAAPNPFTTHFNLNYKAAERETITIRLFNVNGQQMLMKNITVNDGNNNIKITEAAKLAKGIYVIQVSRGHDIISSSKIIKQ